MQRVEGDINDAVIEDRIKLEKQRRERELDLKNGVRTPVETVMQEDPMDEQERVPVPRARAAPKPRTRAEPPKRTRVAVVNDSDNDVMQEEEEVVQPKVRKPRAKAKPTQSTLSFTREEDDVTFSAVTQRLTQSTTRAIKRAKLI
jgi:hypothetical protein